MRFQLFRAGVLLGVVTRGSPHGADDSGWLEPSPECVEVRPLFEHEQQLLNWAMRSQAESNDKGARRSAWLVELAAGLQREIIRPGAWLVSLTDGRRIELAELHIEDNQARWR
jgi:hypothetical protein